MKIKPNAILFDMDGVLVDSLESWWKALNRALKEYDHEEISKDSFIEIYWGHDLRLNLRKMNLNPEVLPFCNNIYGEYIDHVKIYQDTIPTLKKLDDYKKAVITNTPSDCAYQILDKLDLSQYFKTVVTSDQVSMGKPNPDIVLKACERLNVKPENCILIGDTYSDVKAGENSGCTVVGLKIKADYSINRLEELIDLVKN